MSSETEAPRRRGRATKPRAGTHISLTGIWKLGRRMAEGGFGQIFEASSIGGQTAVVKLVPKAPGAQRELLFDLPEAPNVLPAIDRGEWGDHWVLVMPRAECSLRERLEEAQGPLPSDDAVAILRDIASGLAGMLGKVVHRDLKPENVLLWQGRWCIADFGIARYAEATTAPDTRKGAWSPPYAAPEQWRFERATPATDVYALGVIGFELIEGRRPYPGPDTEAFREQHLHGKPSEPSRADPRLRALLLECLLKEPQARPTAANVLERLQQPAQPKSPGLARLQEAYGRQVSSDLVDQGRRAREAEEEVRHRELHSSAKEALQALIVRVEDTLRDLAPTARIEKGSGLTIHLGQARLMIEALQRNRFDPPTRARLGFEVISLSKISITYLQPRGSWDGRSHSLWFCNAMDRAAYRLVELAFMTAWTDEVRRIEPFALDPDEDAFLALGPAMHIYQSAWSFTPVDQGEEDKFIDRWLGWLGDAAHGNLHRPSSLPETR